MEPSRWTRSALALCIMGTLTACGSGSDNNAGEGDIADLPEPPPVVVVPPEESGIVNTPLPFLENFGEYTGFDVSDTEDFFSQNYKSLATAEENSEYEDTFPQFYYPTCCFFLEDDPNMGPDVDLGRLGIVSDAGDPTLLVSNARFSIGQTKSDLAGSATDPKKDSTSGSAASGWGEFDLSEPYRISFCVASAEGSGSDTQIYVDNNTTGEANSLHGSDSIIFDIPTDALVAGKRVVVNVPGDVYLEHDGEPVLDVPELVGTEQSFLQFRVSSGGMARIDDLLIEKQSDDGQAELPACAQYQPAERPEMPQDAAPTLFATDAQMTVSWSAVLNASTYDVAYGTSNDVNTATLMEGVDDTKATLSELENGTEYFVWFRAENNVGESDWSAPATATPMAPVGDNCVATTEVGDSPTHMISWGVYDGCTHPNTVGSVIVKGSQDANFALDEDEVPFFEVSEQGILTLDTIGKDAKPVGDLSDVISSATYPKYFTFIARIDTSYASSQDVRGFEIETHLGDVGIEGRGPARIKTILRPDSGDNGKIQLERFLSTLEDDGDEETAEVEVDMSDGYHTYQFSFIVDDPAGVDGDDYITATIYRDGEQVGSFVGNGRDGGSSSSKMRIGEGSSSDFHANVDWIVWSDKDVAASLAPDELVGELPSGIGDLAGYAGEDQVVEDNVVLAEDFDSASPGDGGDSDFFTAAYRTLEEGSTDPMYNVTSSGSRIMLENGQLTFGNARFSIGESNPDTDTKPVPDGSEPTTDQLDPGALDLSKPYVISFDVEKNENVATDSGKCQVYVDNNTTSSGNSIHGGDSKIFEEYAAVMVNGDPTGTVIITSGTGEELVGTAKSFLQLRCDSGTEAAPITIDNFKITYQ